MGRRQRNQIWPWIVCTLLALSARFANADEGPAGPSPILERVEVPIGQIFVPPMGYDDNDNVQIVLDGILPNACYQVADEAVHADPVTKKITAHLFAYRRTDGPCADPQHLPTSLLPSVPYTLDVSLGALPAGSYRIFYPRPGLVEGIRSFKVERAHTSAIDNFPYAAVSSVWIPDTVRGDLAIHADLVGSLTSSCSHLDDISVKQEGDVFVVLPVLSFQENVLCAMVMLPFQRTITLPKVSEGRYLIHVRSMNGRSVNRAFSAVAPDP